MDPGSWHRAKYDDSIAIGKSRRLATLSWSVFGLTGQNIEQLATCHRVCIPEL
jgi:hypothetical protein